MVELTMKATAVNGLGQLICDAIVDVKKKKEVFDNAEKLFYDKNSTIDVQKAINLKKSKEQFEKATLRLYDALTAERIIKELKNKGIEI